MTELDKLRASIEKIDSASKNDCTHQDPYCLCDYENLLEMEALAKKALVQVGIWKRRAEEAQTKARKYRTRVFRHTHEWEDERSELIEKCADIAECPCACSDKILDLLEKENS